MDNSALVTQLTIQVTQAVANSINAAFSQVLEKQELTDKRVSVIEKRINEEITLNYKEQLVVQEAKRTRVNELMKNRFGIVRMNSELKSIRCKLYERLGRSLKKRFLVGSYKDIKHHELNEALNFIEIWVPDWNHVVDEVLKTA